MNMKLAEIFSDGMVLQANRPVRIFGSGRGTVEIDFLGKKYSLCSEKEEWEVELEPQDFGGPYQMDIKLNGVRKTFLDIVFGDVILCAGQSNMQFEIGLETDGAQTEPNSRVRYFHSDNIEGHGRLRSAMGWLPADQKNIPDFSALAYHIAAGLAQKRDRYIGIVSCVQGASVIRSWLSPEVLTPDVYIPLNERHADSFDPAYAAFNQDGACYAKSFLPVAPYAVSAVIWYQGESDTSVAEGKIYFKLLKKLITLWREKLRDENLPFVIVQICDLDIRADEGWRAIQTAQLRAGREIAGVKTVTSSDVCEHTQIHPSDKRALAEKILDAIEPL